MLQRLIDDIKQSATTTIRLASLIAIAAVALFITISFLCAAAFVFVLERQGPVAACLTGAATFLIVTVIMALSYVMRKRALEARAAEAARSAARSAFADPMLIATGLQLARAIGFKRLLPILAIGGLALGFLASRPTTEDQAPAE